MRNIIKRVNAVILICAMLISCLVPGIAMANQEAVKVTVPLLSNISANNTIDLLIKNNTAYISIHDAAKLSGFSLDSSTAEILFSHYEYRVKYSMKEALQFEGATWLPVDNTLQSLLVRYHLSKQGLVAAANTHSVWSLMDYANTLLSNEGYTLDFLNNWGGALGILFSAFWDIISFDFSLDEKEDIREVYYDLIQPPQQDEDILDRMETAGGGYKDLSTIYNTFTYIDPDNEVMDLMFGEDFSAILGIVVEMNDSLQDKFAMGEMIELANDIKTARDASIAYVTMLEKGLVQPEYPGKDSLLTSLASEMVRLCLSGYESPATTAERVIVEAARTGFSEMLKSRFAAVSTGAQFAELIVELYTRNTTGGVRANTTAMQKTLIFRSIQKQAQSCYISARDRIINGDVTRANAEALKYSALLYIKCARDTYALYECDTEIAAAVGVLLDKLDTAIVELLAYNDELLTPDSADSKIDIDLLNEFISADNPQGANPIRAFMWLETSFGYSDYEPPIILLYSNGTLIATLNKLEYMEILYGEYSANGDTINISISDNNGYSVATADLTKSSDNRYIFNGEGIFSGEGSFSLPMNGDIYSEADIQECVNIIDKLQHRVYFDPDSWIGQYDEYVSELVHKIGIQQDNLNHTGGITQAARIDFDGDGTMELLLAYQPADGNDYPILEIYTYYDGNIVQLEQQTLGQPPTSGDLQNDIQLCMINRNVYVKYELPKDYEIRQVIHYKMATIIDDGVQYIRFSVTIPENSNYGDFGDFSIPEGSKFYINGREVSKQEYYETENTFNTGRSLTLDACWGEPVIESDTAEYLRCYPIDLYSLR